MKGLIPKLFEKANMKGLMPKIHRKGQEKLSNIRGRKKSRWRTKIKERKCLKGDTTD